MFAEGELADIYKTDFIMVKEHGFRLTELDEMMPFERDTFIGITISYLDKKNKALKNQNKGYY